MRGFALALLLLVSGQGGPGVAMAEAVGLVTGVAPDCAAHGDDAGRSPLAHCAHCCILCDGGCPLAGARLSAEATPSLSLGVVAPGAPRAATNGANCLDGRPPGWASSWSSQAPPRFS